MRHECPIVHPISPVACLCVANAECLAHQDKVLFLGCALGSHPNIALAATGKLRGPENLYENVTAGAFNKVERQLPATKGEVQDITADLTAYKNETTAVINALVSEINSLTPVRDLSKSLPGWQYLQACP